MSLKVIVNGNEAYTLEGELKSARAVFYHDDGRVIAEKGTDCETLAAVEIELEGELVKVSPNGQGDATSTDVGTEAKPAETPAKPKRTRKK